MEEYMEDPVTPTMDGLIESCPRFRLLIIGRAGCGLSSLVQRIFRISLPDDSESIEQEIAPDKNPRLVLHRHSYVQSSEGDSSAIVKEFIRKRAAMPELKDKLHAIWLCVPIPLNSDNMFDEVDAKILQLDFGSVPIFVAFTKYDLLVRSKISDKLTYTGQVDAAMRIEANDLASNVYDDACILSFQAINKDLPHRSVSTLLDREDTLRSFVRMTFDRVQHGDISQIPPRFSSFLRSIFGPQELEDESARREKAARDTLAIMFASAQMIDVDCKIDAAISVGRREHWANLYDNRNFKGKVMRQCSNAIHRDMVLIWNLIDVEEYLMSRAFRSDVSRIVGELENPGIGITKTGLPRSMYEDARAMSRHEGYTHPITGQGLYFSKWAYEDYKQDRNTLRCLMAYIVDLNVLLKRILLNYTEGSIESVHRITESFQRSRDKMRIHDTLRIFVERAKLAKALKRDFLLGRVVALIEDYRPQFA